VIATLRPPRRCASSTVFPNDRPVAQMNPIECADGDHGIRIARNFAEMTGRPSCRSRSAHCLILDQIIDAQRIRQVEIADPCPYKPRDTLRTQEPPMSFTRLRTYVPFCADDGETHFGRSNALGVIS